MEADIALTGIGSFNIFSRCRREQHEVAWVWYLGQASIRWTPFPDYCIIQITPPPAGVGPIYPFLETPRDYET